MGMSRLITLPPSVRSVRSVSERRTGCSITQPMEPGQAPWSTAYQKQWSWTGCARITISGISLRNCQSFVMNRGIWTLRIWNIWCHGRQNFQKSVENHAADEAAFVYSQAYGLTFTNSFTSNMENQGIKKEREGTSASLSFFDGLSYDIFYFPP